MSYMYQVVFSYNPSRPHIENAKDQPLKIEYEKELHIWKCVKITHQLYGGFLK